MPGLTPPPHKPSARRANPVLLQALADLFKHLGDPSRLRLLLLLSEQELSVGALSSRLGLSLSAVSHQLRHLRLARLVATRRKGKTIFYSLSDEHVRQLIHTGEEHARERFE